MNVEQIPADWRAILQPELEAPYWRQLQDFVTAERRDHTIYPPENDVFTALRLTPYERVNVLLLGQDPYHGPGQAHGLCFSVLEGVTPPPSLVNMFKERQSDVGIPRPVHGNLANWAEQGILMLNTVLTVRAGQPNSHKGQGWERFTDAIIRAVNLRHDPVVFVLWGNHAQKKRALIDLSRHTIIQSAHPSPLSAHNGFFGSKPYSTINAALRQHHKPEIDWNT